MNRKTCSIIYGNIATLIMIVMLICICPIYAYASEPTDYTGTHIVRVGYFPIDGFQEYDEETGVYSGYSYEFLMAISAYTDWQYEFVPCDTFEEALVKLENGEIDLLNDVVKRPEREEKLEFSNLIAGDSCLYLLMHADDNSVAYNDWEGIENIKIGLDQESIHSDTLLELFKEHGITPNITWYANEPELMKAWDAGEIDAYPANSDTAVEGHAVLIFAPGEYYLATTKGNTELISEVDFAIQELRSNAPDFEAKIRSKYYNKVSKNYSALTKEEQEYVKENPVVRVLYVPDWYPISYQDENGNFAGPFTQIYTLLQERTGLQFEFVPLESDIPFEGIVETYNCYMLAEHPADYIGATAYDVKLTQTFVNAAIVEVTKGTLRQGDTIALVEGDSLSEVAQRLFGDNFKYIFTDSIHDCITKVQNGEVDGTILMSYESEYYKSQRKYSNLIYTTVNDGSYGFGLAVSNKADPRLYSIIVKGLNSLSSGEINNIFNQMTQDLQKPDLLDVVLENPLPFVILLIIFCIAVVSAFSGMYFNKKIRMKNEELMNANAAKSDFLSRMSHELRTPLNALTGYTDMTEENILSDTPDTKVQLQNLSHIRDASKYLLRIIDDILDMQNTKRRRTHLNLVPVNIEKYIGIILEEISKEAKEKGVQFTVERRTQLSQFYKIDDIRCGQIIMNVLHNAVKFTPEGGSVHITIEATDLEGDMKEIKVVVSDTGIGMSKEFIHKKLFTNFAQEDQSLESPYEGCGIGLALCKELLDLMGGTISCESEKGKGSIFTIVFCAEAVNTERKKRTERKEQPAYDLSGTRILLCEDNPMNQDIEKRILEKMKCEVDIAADGKIGLEKFNQHDAGYYHMILMDVRMPNMDGLETTRKIRESKKGDAATIPILAVSANAFDEDIKASLDAGMNEHLAKPVSAKILYEKITNYIKM